MKKLIILGLFGVAVSFTASAEEGAKSLHDQFTGQPYGTAGCGLGSMIFGDKAGMVQIFAATSNGLAGNQTFAISSGTSNCDDSNPSAAIQTGFFVSQNEVALKNDIARGQGETLIGLATVANCKNAGGVAEVLKANFTTIYPSDADASQSAGETIVNILDREKSLSCQLG